MTSRSKFRAGMIVWCRMAKAKSPANVMGPVRIIRRVMGGGVEVELPDGAVVQTHWRFLRAVSLDDAEKEFVLRRVTHQ